MKLYNLAIGDFPIDQLFYSVQVFKCDYCGALTNKTYWANCFMGGARVYCPNEEEAWHHRIFGLRQRGLCEVRPKSYEDAVQKEVEEILAANPPKHDLVGSPDITWEAQAVLQSGYVMDGIGFRPHGRKTLPLLERLQPTKFVEEVFERISVGYPEDVIKCVRWDIVFGYEFRIALKEEEVKRGGRCREAVEAAHERLRTLLGEKPSKPEGFSEEEKIKFQKQIKSLDDAYDSAYEQWIADKRLAKIERYRVLGIGQ